MLETNREDAKEEAEGLRGGFSYNLILGASLVRQSSPPRCYVCLNFYR